MGLAASQARFLGITARKNSCELRSMQVAQEKLSITNQLTQISLDYQNSLDATRLVWDSEATNGEIFDVSYDLLMSPSSLNQYSPQLLTNNKNQVILNSQYANAIKDMVAGQKVNKATGEMVEASFWDYRTGGAERSQNNFKEFLKNLNKGGVLSSTNYTKMVNALDRNPKLYNPKNGLGGTVTEAYTSSSMNLATLKSYIKSITDPNSKYLNNLKQEYGTAYDADGNLIPGSAKTVYDSSVEMAKYLNFGGYEYHALTGKDSSGNPITETRTGSFGESIAKEFQSELKITDTNFNFADLLSKEITLSSDNQGQMADALQKYITNLYDIMLNVFAIDRTSVDMDYLNYAMSQVADLCGMKYSVDDYKRDDGQAIFKFKPDDSGKYINDAKVYNTGDQAYKHTGLIKNGNNYQVSLSNLAKAMLTYFEKAVEGFDSGYKIDSQDDKKVDDSFYVTQDPEYYYIVQNPEAMDDDNETQMLLNYYSQMFNQICANGWTENDLVDDKENLKNMLKNGTIFSTTLSEMDGMFYQGAYTSNNFIAEVRDEDAIARAEAKYKTKQLQLNAKEEELDIDMQQIDAELSALTTEYDTVKSLISKAVEKGFSTLSGG